MVINHSKDILLICKGHYNKEKYDSPIDALKVYQAEYSGCEKKYITDETILTILLDVAKEYFKDFEWYWWMFKEGIVKDIDFAQSGLMPKKYPEREIKLSYQYLIEKFIIGLCMLPVKDNKDNWIIDLSEYDNIGDIV